jgi:hypothetical protein
MLPKARGPGLRHLMKALLRAPAPQPPDRSTVPEKSFTHEYDCREGTFPDPGGGAGSSRRQNAHHVRKFHSAPAASGSVGGLKKELTMPGRGREHEVRRLIRDLEALATTNEPTGN